MPLQKNSGLEKLPICIAMPSTRTIIRLYEHLQNSLEAGLPLPAAWSCAPPAARKATDGVVRALESGYSLPEALQSSRQGLPAFDRQMLAAAAETARLPETFGRLAQMHQRQQQMRRSLAASLAYPLILVHLAAVLFPILGAVDLEEGGLQWEPASYFISVGGALILLWSGLGLLFLFLSQPLPLLQRLRAYVPVAGKYQRLKALADFCFALSMLLDARVSVAKAWRLAGSLSGLVRLEQAAEDIARRVELGASPGSMMADYPIFPGFVASACQTAESTGSTVETLEKQSVVLGKMAGNTLKMLWIILPILAVLLVALLVAWHVLSFFARYLDLLESF